MYGWDTKDLGNQESPPFVSDHMTFLAIYVLTLDPALLEETTPFTLATILSTVFDIFMPLLPVMFVSAICAPATFVLRSMHCLTNVVLSHCTHAI